MKNPIMALLVTMISFLLIAGPSNGRTVLVKSNLFIAPNNPLGFDPNLNALVEEGSRLHTADGHVEKDTMQCDQERPPSPVKGATDEKKLFSRFSPSVQKPMKPHSPADSAKKAEGIFNTLPNGAVTLSEPSSTINSLLTKQQPFTSSNSPRVGHVQTIRINTYIHKCHRGDRNDQVQQKKSNNRKLGSAPSPGGGHHGGH